MTASENKSVLIIGATGRTGLACLRHFASSNYGAVHAFSRDKSKYSQKDAALCTSIIEGNARSTTDLERALSSSAANLVIVSVGNGDDVSKSDIRTTNAQALVQVLQSKPEFRSIRVIAVSSTGAGNSQIKVGLGIGKLIEHHLRHVLADHTGQEEAFAAIQDQVTLVRPTSLTEDAPTDNLIEFGDKVKSPTIKTDRADLAKWVVREAQTAEHQGTIVNVTGVKARKQ
mmetsp:Transcript_3342/g.6987  ORF Transcript_3342/g.6987 Transcript_3342/m.6987 type:complete len:229 (-) Transcript_3342:115-801(-)|eukprot:CAMPEP_0168753986 /NCGR_PEP_ID=MMETSP0724-20121128/19259_1 /TAXON_ID=265536 /ORGANISM="Amphiprora sp., Strain CCMP467" /LENGTH=228 /DNA_ID=CAMNT_0008802433 /DNA_START=6 /DNA_END=692 /DNA_ORIENTATION=+